MRGYGQIQCAFWQSDQAQKASDAGKLLAAYLMTGPHSNGIGCYRCPDGYIMEDLGWTSERVSEGFSELSRNGFAYRYEGVVCIPNFLRWKGNEVRVFDVRHIKGLEFEAVFFAGVDRLAVDQPSLFERYLYVGATRAATYLGLTCYGHLPARLEPMRTGLEVSW